MTAIQWATTLALTAALSCAPASAQDVLVDTGPGSNTTIGSPAMFNSGSVFQFLAGRITMSESFTIGTIQGWMLAPSGTLNVKLRENNASNRPGNEIFTASYPVSFTGTIGWQSFGGLDWTQPAGTYWICFEPTAGTTGGNMPIGAPNPLASYAFFGNDNPGYALLGVNSTLGFRVLGPTPPQPLLVPSEYPTIQSAIDSALDGQSILVSAGTYAESINFSGKTITVESADGPALTTIDASSFNQSAVTIGFGSAAATRLEGFTITGGSATSGLGYGGGILFEGAAGSIVDCIIHANTAESGGGAAMYFGSNAAFNNCTFSSNAGSGKFSSGGGAYINGSSATFTDCTFTGNSVSSGGGGINVNNNATAIVTGCTFTKNTAGNAGGAALIISSTASATFTDCTFDANEAVQAGAVGSNNAATVLTDCIFTSNTATTASPTSGGGLQVQGSGSIAVTGCTFDSNSGSNGGGALFIGFSGTATIIGCDFRNNTATVLGGAVRTSSSTASPSIGTTHFCGNSPDDIAGPFTDAGGNTFDASCDPATPGDLNGDGVVGPADLGMLLGSWGACSGCPADLNGDGVVGPADLGMLLGNWG